MEAEKAELTAGKLQGVPGVPFQKGDDPRRNSEGRPKGSYSIVALIRKKAQELFPDDPDKQKTYGDKVVEEMYKKAIGDKDISSIKEIIDRIDGKAPQHISQDIKGEMSVNNATDELLRRIDGIASRIGKTPDNKG
jgi:hypothetical protein